MIHDEILALRKKIKEYNYQYHVLDNPLISDYEYDKLFNDLLKLEQEHPEFYDANSPTLKVGGEILDKFTKVRHEFPMLSLGNAFSLEDLEEFDQRVKKQYKDAHYDVELKIDGLAMSVTYVDGNFTQAVTRGDGVEGEDVTHNVKVIQSVPLKLNQPLTITVRGEVFMPLASFEKVNKKREENNEQVFANCRNAAAGTIRQLDSSVVAKRGLDAFWFGIVNAETYGLKTQEEALKFLVEIGLKTNKEHKTYSNIEDVWNRINEIDALRNTLPYEIDGAVIKVNELDYQEALGYTVRIPRFATSYKYKALEVESLVEDIFVTVGRTGKITPNAKLKPVSISGSIVSYATLHNEDYIKSKDIRISDAVLVRKAGEIIPEIVSVDLDKRSKEALAYEFPKTCPACDGELVRFEDESAHYCINVACPAKISEALVHFASRDAMNIDSMGEKRTYQLYEAGLISSIEDIFTLEERQDKLLELENTGPKSVTKLLESIEASKANSLEKLLFGLGIRHVGLKTSTILAQSFKEIDNLIGVKEEALIKIDEIGSIIAKSVAYFFNEPHNIELIKRLKELGLNTKYEDLNVSNVFEDMRFVITGTMHSMKRNDIKALIESLGGNVVGSVSAKTTVVVYGESAGSKLTKANELGIETWSEEVFLQKVSEYEV